MQQTTIERIEENKQQIDLDYNEYLKKYKLEPTAELFESFCKTAYNRRYQGQSHHKKMAITLRNAIECKEMREIKKKPKK
jgi:hypothetical protein